MEKDGKYYFVLNEFLDGAKKTARNVDSEFIVTDRSTGKPIGGIGIIMSRLIDIVENYRDGKGECYKAPIEI